MWKCRLHQRRLLTFVASDKFVAPLKPFRVCCWSTIEITVDHLRAYRAHSEHISSPFHMQRQTSEHNLSKWNKINIHDLTIEINKWFERRKRTAQRANEREINRNNVNIWHFVAKPVVETCYRKTLSRETEILIGARKVCEKTTINRSLKSLR